LTLFKTGHYNHEAHGGFVAFVRVAIVVFLGFIV
jgi:hypothetical protein